MSNGLDALIARLKNLQAIVSATPKMVWATVSGVNPLRLILDGEQLPLSGSPATTVSNISVGDRVMVMIQRGRATVIGNGGGGQVPAGALQAVAYTPSATNMQGFASDWLLCDGSLKTRADFPRLFALIGTAFGSTSATDFRVPDLRGRTLVGLVPTDPDLNAVGKVFGTKTHTLTRSETPAQGGYTFLWGSGAGNVNILNAIAASGPGDANRLYTNSADASLSPHAGGQAHNNMQPSLAINYLIKT